MALRAEFSLVHSEFNDFLFSFVGEEKSGLQLTVLSAFARLGLDPWGEAARLADLPKEAATRALASAIAGLPAGDWKVSDAQPIAIRLVNSLPRRGAFSAKSSQAASVEDRKPASNVGRWLVWVALTAAALIAMLLMNGD